jgi:PPOX class probable F420-dependent enzyme
MNVDLSPAALGRLTRESLFWIATIRRGGAPHLAPVWYVWHDNGPYLFIDGVKLSNLQANPAASLALQDGVRPVILEGRAEPVTDRVVFDSVAARYRARFAWDISAESKAMELVQVIPHKALHWNGESRAEELPIPASRPADPAAATRPDLQRAAARLYREPIIWLATVRAEGRPHLVPIWHVWHGEKIYISTGQDSVKLRNLRHEPRMALALPDAMDVVLVEGTARPAPELDDELVPHFKQKFDWDFRQDKEYGALVEITPSKILAWRGGHGEETHRLL